MNKGFGLVEVIVASLLLCITVVAGMSIYAMNIRTSAQQEQYYYAENILRQCVEEIKDEPYHLDSTKIWQKIDSVRLKHCDDFKYTTIDKKSVITYTVELDTAIIRADSAKTPFARLKVVKATAKWLDKSLSLSTVVDYDYRLPGVPTQP